MALGGLGWMTFISPPLAHYVSPYNMLSLTVWLLVFGVNQQRWKQQAGA